MALLMNARKVLVMTDCRDRDKMSDVLVLADCFLKELKMGTIKVNKEDAIGQALNTVTVDDEYLNKMTEFVNYLYKVI